MNPVIAGLLAAIPLSLAGIIYMLVKGHAFVEVVKSGSSDSDPMTDAQWYYLMLGAMALAPLAFGAVAGLVYGWIDNPVAFIGLAVGLAVVFTLLTWRSHTPMALTKSVMNFLVALDFGVLIPLVLSY